MKVKDEYKEKTCFRIDCRLYLPISVLKCLQKQRTPLQLALMNKMEKSVELCCLMGADPDDLKVKVFI